MEARRGARGRGASSSHREDGATKRRSGKKGEHQREGVRAPDYPAPTSTPKPTNPAFARLMQKLVSDTDGNSNDGESSGLVTYNNDELLMVRDTMERPTCPSELPPLLISSTELPLPRSAISTRRRSSSNVSNDSPQQSRLPPGPSRLNSQMAPSSGLTGGRQGDRGNRGGPSPSLQEQGGRNSTTREGRDRDRDRGRYERDGFGERGGGGYGRREKDDLWDTPLAEDAGLMPSAHMDMAALFEAERQSYHRGNGYVMKEEAGKDEGGENEEIKQAVVVTEPETALTGAPPCLEVMNGAAGKINKGTGGGLGKDADEDVDLTYLSSVGGMGRPRSVRDLSIDLDTLVIAGVLGQGGVDRAEQPVGQGRGAAGANLPGRKPGVALDVDPFRSALFSFAPPGEAHSTIDLYREMTMQQGAAGDALLATASGATATSRLDAWASSTVRGMEGDKGLGMAGADPWAHKAGARPTDPWANKPGIPVIPSANGVTTHQPILGFRVASSLPHADGVTTPAVIQGDAAKTSKGADLMSLLGFDKGAGGDSGTATRDSTEAQGRGEAPPVAAKPASHFAFRSTTSTARPPANAARPRPPPPQPLHALPGTPPDTTPGCPLPSGVSKASTGAAPLIPASLLTAQRGDASKPTAQHGTATGGGHVMPPHYGPRAPHAYPTPLQQHMHAQAPRQVVYAYVPPMPPPPHYHYHPHQHQHFQYQNESRSVAPPPRAYQEAAPQSGAMNGQGLSNGLAKLFGAGAAINRGAGTTTKPDGKVLSLAEIEQQHQQRR